MQQHQLAARCEQPQEGKVVPSEPRVCGSSRKTSTEQELRKAFKGNRASVKVCIHGSRRDFDLESAGQSVVMKLWQSMGNPLSVLLFREGVTATCALRRACAATRILTIMPCIARTKSTYLSYRCTRRFDKAMCRLS